MEIIVFVIMMAITVAGLAYPLWRRPAAQVAVASVIEQAEVIPAHDVPCTNCGRALKVDERFCPGCGTPVGDRCNNCGRVLDGDEAFCPGCGTKIGQA